MWRSSKKRIVDCIRFILRCGRHNLDVDDLEDIPEYDPHDVPVYFQPQSFGASIVPRQDDLQHRPDAPGFRRRSPPEIVTKVRQALEEMDDKKNSAKARARGDHLLDLALGPREMYAAASTEDPESEDCVDRTIMHLTDDTR